MWRCLATAGLKRKLEENVLISSGGHEQDEHTALPQAFHMAGQGAANRVTAVAIESVDMMQR